MSQHPTVVAAVKAWRKRSRGGRHPGWHVQDEAGNEIPSILAAVVSGPARLYVPKERPAVIAPAAFVSPVEQDDRAAEFERLKRRVDEDVMRAGGLPRRMV